MPSPEVIVLDSEKRFLEYTTPGAARTLLKKNKARIFSRSPFAVILLHAVEANSIRRSSVMTTPRNFTEYFKDERDVYVQNISNAQVSCEFPIAPGRTEGFLFPHTRDPVNLSQFIPFAAVKSSMDFRKMLSRRPPVLQLLNMDEFEAYFSKKAKSVGMVDASGKPDVDAAIDASEEKRRRTADRTLRETVTDKTPEPLHDVIEKGSGPHGEVRFGERSRVASREIVAADDVINPKILHLCNQVKNEIPEEERMPAKDLLEDLQSLPGLTLDDLEHIRAHGFYKSVKKWARQEMSKMSDASEVEEKEEEKE